MVATVLYSPLAYLEMLGKRELYVKVVTNAFILMRISEKSLTTVPWRWLMNFKIAPRPSVIMSAALGRGCWSPNRSLVLLQRNIPLPLDFDNKRWRPDVIIAIDYHRLHLFLWLNIKRWVNEKFWSSEECEHFAAPKLGKEYCFISKQYIVSKYLQVDTNSVLTFARLV